MSEEQQATVTLPADVQQVDATGFVWTFLDLAEEPARVRPAALIVAGPGGRSIVHLDVVGVPDQAIDELRHARLLPQ